MSDAREPPGRRAPHTPRPPRDFNAGLEKPFGLGEWEDRHPKQRELDMRIGAAVEAAVRERIAAHIEAIAANYPEDVFPTTGISRDAISGAAMRLAYRIAAKE